MTRNPVSWFEIPVLDMSRAKKFYEAVLNIQLQALQIPDEPNVEMMIFPGDPDLPGATGILVRYVHAKPTDKPGIMVYFCSDDVSNELSRVEGAGGKVAMPKTDIGEHGFTGSFIDTEGNLVSLHSRK